MSNRPPIVGSAIRRLVWRELAQNKWRTFSLFLLTLLPVMFAWAAAVSLDGGSSLAERDPEAFTTLKLGQADGQFFGLENPTDLPGDPTIVSWHEDSATIGQLGVIVSDFPADEPLVEGIRVLDSFVLAAGNFPVLANEVALSQRALDAFSPGVLLGDTIRWGDDSFQVVGLLDDQEPIGGFFRSGSVLFAPGSLRTGFATMLLDWQGDIPIEISDRRTQNFDEDIDRIQLRRDLLAANFVSDELSPALIGAVFMTGISIATGAIAFVAWRTSAARRLRDIGLLSSSGATTGQVAAMQGLQAFVISTTAVVVAALIGVGVVLQWRSFFFGEGQPVQFPVGGLIAPALIGVAVATAAAWWPARQAARVPLASVLAGRLTEAPPQALSPLVGFLLVVIGFFALSQSASGQGSETAFILWGGGGLIAIAVGALPILAMLFRSGSHRAVGPALPVAGRLVARSLSRHAGRSAATVLGIGAIVAAVWAGAIDAQENIDGGSSLIFETRSDGETTFLRSEITIADQGVFVGISHPDPIVRRQLADEVVELGGSDAQRFELLGSAQVEGGTLLQPEQGTFAGTRTSLRTVVPRGAEVVPEVRADDDFLRRNPALDVTVIAFPVDLDVRTADTLVADDRLVVAGVGRDLGLAEASNSDGDRLAQRILLAIGIAVATFVIALVAHVVSEEARSETSLVELLGTGRRFTKQFLSLQILVLAGTGVVAGLLVGTLIRFSVDVGFFLPTQVFAGLVLLPFALAAATYVFGARGPSAVNY